MPNGWGQTTTTPTNFGWDGINAPLTVQEAMNRPGSGMPALGTDALSYRPPVYVGNQATPAAAPAAAPIAPRPRATPQPRPQIGMLGGGGGGGYDKQFENMLRIFLPMLGLQSRAGMYGLGGMMPQQPQADAGTFASRYNTPQGQAQPMQPQGQSTLGFRSRYG